MGLVLGCEPPHVTIWTSATNEKCVENPHGLHCAPNSGNRGNRGLASGYGDTFEVSHRGSQVCARRTDHNAGWGMGLVLGCSASITMVVGEEGASCSDACHAIGATCDGATLARFAAGEFSVDELHHLAMEAGHECTEDKSWAYPSTPSVCTNSACCGDGSCTGICAFGVQCG